MTQECRGRQLIASLLSYMRNSMTACLITVASLVLGFPIICPTFMRNYLVGCDRNMKGYGALVLRLTDEVVEALFVTYDLWK